MFCKPKLNTFCDVMEILRKVFGLLEVFLMYLEPSYILIKSDHLDSDNSYLFCPNKYC